MRTGASRWPLVGCEGELDVFKRVWADRQIQGVVISGGAGVGKSRLAEAFLARAVRLGARGGRATATAAATPVPLGAIAHLIPAGVDLADPVRGFAAAAEALAGRQPYALLVDDLHLLDAASTVLLRQLMDARVIRLIGTVRSGQPGGAASAALAGGSAVHRVDLTELDPVRTGAVLEAALGGPVARGARHALHTATRGNLRYLRELVTWAVQSQALTCDGEIWELAGDPPAGPALTDLVEARLAAVPAGRPALELLALCEPLDASSVASPETLADLDAAGLIRAGQDRRRTTLTLAYPLHGTVLRAGLSPLRRRTLLLDQCARTRAAGARRRGDAMRLAAWELTATGTAGPALLAAGAAQAREAGDFGAALRLLGALPPEEHTVATRTLTGEALSRLGRWEQAEAVLAKLSDEPLGEAEVLAVALIRVINLLYGGAGVSEVLEVTTAARGRVATAAGRRSLRVHEGYARIALGQVGAGLTLLADLAPETVDAEAWLAGARAKAVGLALTGRSDEAARWSEHARAAYRSCARRPLSHPAAHGTDRVLAATEAGRLTEAVGLTEGESRRAYPRPDGPPARGGEDPGGGVMRPAAGVASMGEAGPDLEGGFAAGAGGAGEDPGGVLARVQTGVVLGRAAWLAGRPGLARRWWAEASSLARGAGYVRALRLLNAGLAACAASVGDLAAADAALAENATLPLLTPLFLSVAEERIGEAWLLAARGRQAQARAVLTDAAGIARATGHVASEALLLTDVARLGGAAEVAARLADLADVCDGDLAPARARFAAALAAGDPGDLLTAAGVLANTGQELAAAEAAAAAAALWRRTREPGRAAAAAREAAAYETRRPAVRTPLLAGTETPAPLSAREQQIAEFAAAGIASKEIAETLALSVRTVHNHLQKIYRKLGINTRRELREILHPHAVVPCRVFPPMLTIGPINRTDRDRRRPSHGRSR
ncbi:LuxR family transcriptional regulator [Actinomadura sp. DC4]|uniref:helix-turn-helix transcriptional regulator n=1 Tax=Actinomadura sp. DC4 TaxID=3055069 RepID=UPI0025B11CAC|nr:LuxR family transcriptional regulator [Actinomadura sp. DC4]MDN3359568.1 LuxR C-terminal-related transcriptional regulator [Actinomadura sp. DC4]